MLNAKKFGLALGIVWGVALLVFTLLGTVSGEYGKAFFDLIASFYPGYNVSLTGALLGGVYAFIDGMIFGYVFVWLYNKLNH